MAEVKISQEDTRKSKDLLDLHVDESIEMKIEKTEEILNDFKQSLFNIEKKIGKDVNYSKRFSSKNQTSKQLKNVKLKEYKCSVCRMTFAQPSKLLSHVKTIHDPTKPFQCRSCDKSFGPQ